MKSKIIMGLACVLLIGGLGYYVFSKQNTNKEEKKVGIDTTKYEEYTFYDVEPKEIKKGEIVYNIDDYVTYSNDKKFTMDISGDGTDVITLSIESGKVKVTRNNKGGYVFKEIDKAVSIVGYSFLSVNDVTIAILTEKNEVYVINSYGFLKEDNKESNYQETPEKYTLKKDAKIEKIGLERDLSWEPHFILKTTDGKYLKLNKEEHTIIESNEFFSNGIVVNMDGTTDMVDETGSVLSAFMNVSVGHPEMYNSYLLTRERYLYEFNEFEESNVAKKYSDKCVVKIGSSKDEKVVIFFEDGEELLLEDYHLVNLEKLEKEEK